MTTLYFVRHGDYENPHHILPSRMKGIALSSLGIKQIKEAGNILVNKKIKATYASPMLRTKQSGRILAQMLDVPLFFSRSLIEVYSPGLQGKDQSIIQEIESYGDTFIFPLHINSQGETLNHIYDRMKRIVNRLLIQYRNDSVAIVSHGDPLMIYTPQIMGKKIDEKHRISSYGTYIPKAGIIKIKYQDKSPKTYQRINF